eukprot:scaffold196_cov371-Prasinococcus_capsulatus_cf.AAC.24
MRWLGQVLASLTPRPCRKLKRWHVTVPVAVIGRVGCETQKLVSGPMSELVAVDFGEPLHSLVITGDLHVVEKEFLQTIDLSRACATCEELC